MKRIECELIGPLLHHSGGTIEAISTGTSLVYLDEQVFKLKFTDDNEVTELSIPHHTFENFVAGAMKIDLLKPDPDEWVESDE